jgi:hypothetical protein
VLLLFLLLLLPLPIVLLSGWPREHSSIPASPPSAPLEDPPPPKIPGKPPDSGIKE